MLDEKQSQIHAEDQDSIKEMQALLAEFAARDNAENPDKPEKSGIELLKHFAEVTEKSAERLAQRVEVRLALGFKKDNLRSFFEALVRKSARRL